MESPNGAPRIVVNGQPVRARMFFGAPGSSALAIGPEWKQIAFEFTATGSADTGTMHFRFGQGVGDVFVDDVRVTDTGDASQDVIPLCDFEGGQPDFDRDWTSWPVGAANTVGKIVVEPRARASGRRRIACPTFGATEWAVAGFSSSTIIPTCILPKDAAIMCGSGCGRCRPARCIVEFYQPGKPFIHLGGLADPFPDQIKMAAEAGVDFVSFPVGLPWPKPGESTNYAAEDSACRTVLAANPQALLIPRIPMNPPDWWRAAHPDEVMQWEDGHRAMAVPASPGNGTRRGGASRGADRASRGEVWRPRGGLSSGGAEHRRVVL